MFNKNQLFASQLLLNLSVLDQNIKNDSFWFEEFIKIALESYNFVKMKGVQPLVWTVKKSFDGCTFWLFENRINFYCVIIKCLLFLLLLVNPPKNHKLQEKSVLSFYKLLHNRTHIYDMQRQSYERINFVPNWGWQGDSTRRWLFSSWFFFSN